MTRMGTQSRYALATPVTMSVTPGPAVTIATPGRPVVRAQPSAACPGRLLVTRVDQPDLVIEGGLEDRVEMPAVQGEDLFDPLLLQHPNQHLAAINTRHQNSSRSISVSSITDALGDQPLHLARL